MSAVAVLLALMTPFANATALVLQRKAAQDAGREPGVAAVTMRDVVRRRAWQLGIAIFVVAVALQVTALSLGSITLVQPFVVLGLPATLVLGGRVLGGALGRYEWSMVALMSTGLLVLLVALRPQGGDALGAGTTVWVVGSAVTLGLLLVVGVVAEQGGPLVRAGLYGLAAGMGSGFVAAVIKAMSQALITDGPLGVLTTWQSYLLIPAAPLAFLALQRSLRAGRLIASQPGFVLGNPLMACFWGVVLLGEQVRGQAALVGGVLGGVAIAIGVVLLARSPLLELQDEAAHPG